ncbi:MAG: hypothetical protein JNM47_01970 [Hyphomonadaceae bacterium]|nr:hypothetical protein [Hyphomonadaceae bacterium]
MRRRSELLVISAALFALCGEVHARPAGGIEGAWTLETAMNDAIGCVIRGEATIAAARNGRHRVQLESVQTCPQSGSFWARETCEATVQAQRVTMACTVVASQSGGYRPDSFDLLREGPSLMKGRLVDTGVWNTDVTWRRATASLVS